jgi:hypothetical protein
MTDRERALDYVAIFINVGDDWRKYAPIDGKLRGNGVKIGTMWVTRTAGGSWLLDDGQTRTVYTRAVAS